MKNFLGIKTTPPLLERSISAAIKLKAELPTDLQMESIPLKDLESLMEEIHVKTRKHCKTSTSTCGNSLGLTVSYKAYKMNS